MAEKFQIEIEVPHGLRAGDRFAVDIEIPVMPIAHVTKVADMPIEQLTMDQLKTERINARSVLYKALRRGDEEAAQSATRRLNIAAREIAKRNGTTIYEEVNAPLGLFEDEDAS